MFLDLCVTLQSERTDADTCCCTQEMMGEVSVSNISSFQCSSYTENNVFTDITASEWCHLFICVILPFELRKC